MYKKKIKSDGPVNVDIDNPDIDISGDMPAKKGKIVKIETQKLDNNVNGLVAERVSVKDEDGEQEYNVEIIKDYHGAVDIFYINKKDPDYEYRFLHNTKENISLKTSNQLFHKGGWQVVPKSHLLRLGFKETMLDVDGHYIQGFNILAFMPKKLFEEKNAQKKLAADERMKTIARNLDGNEDGLVTSEKMGMGRNDNKITIGRM